MTNSREEDTPGFAPDEPDDGRKLGDWATRYDDPQARKAIREETVFLYIHFGLTLILLTFINSGVIEECDWINVSTSRVEDFRLMFTSGLCGMFGGVLLSLKWLYHSVAKELWNVDRRLWRFSTPYLSGGVAFVVWVTITSGLFGIFDSSRLGDVRLAMAVGFISGYFSDMAIAKLSEIAQGVFGTTNKRR